MIIGFFGDSIWAQNTLIKLLKDDRYKIAYVVPRYNNPDTKLIEIASNFNIPVILTENVNSSQFINQVNSMNVDLNVSMSFDQIIKNELIHLAPKGFINCHAGALPFYRGRNILNWALINGESSFGITVHYIDEGIDTGDIIYQHIESIGSQETYNDLLTKCYNLCPEVLSNAIDNIYNGKVKRVKQMEIHPIGFYCGKRIEGDEIINWNWESIRIYNFIRAISYPAPYAQTMFNNSKIKIAKAKLIDNAPKYIGTCGEIVGRTVKGNIVKTGDSTILIEKIVSEDDLTLRVPQFPVGSRLG